MVSSRSGLTIKYPRNWSVTTCHQCEDPRAPGVFVAFLNPSTHEIVMIEPLADKPAQTPIDDWLSEVNRSVNASPEAKSEWVVLGREKALKAIHRHPDLSESETLYVVHHSKTFAIQADRHSPPYSTYQRLLSTFRY